MSEGLKFETRDDAVIGIAQALYERAVRRRRDNDPNPSPIYPTWEALSINDRLPYLVDSDLVVDCLLEYVKNNPGAYGESHEPS
uniref:Uncharacterized protein n=1 Tax=Caulobacter phage BL57 TaxID=3348355 RepID=A0AB74ULQ5_9VIRU